MKNNRDGAINIRNVKEPIPTKNNKSGKTPTMKTTPVNNVQSNETTN